VNSRGISIDLCPQILRFLERHLGTAPR